MRADDFIEIYDNALPEESWLAPDGVTIIPRLFDFCRSVDLTAVTAGQKEAVYISWENPKQCYKFNVNADGSLSLEGLAMNRGEYGSAYDSDGNFYLAEGQIFVYNKDGRLTKRLEVEERAWSMEVGGKNDEYLFVTTNSSFYRIRLK